MEVLSEAVIPVATRASMSARVLADARRSFAGIDAVILERQVEEVVAALWTDSTKVTTFIPVLALRDLRERFVGRVELPQA